MEGNPDGAGEFSCRSCEKITHRGAVPRIARARAGASLLAMILYAKSASIGRSIGKVTSTP